MRVCKLVLLIVVFVVLTITGFSQPMLTFTPVITSGLTGPTQMVNAGDGTNRIFIVQKGGTILVFDASYSLLSTFLTVAGITTNGERGLLSMVFHPDYVNNGLFFVYYTNGTGGLELARYKVSSNPNVADVSSKVVVLTIPHPTYSNHNGGEMHFGSDGYLYLSTGDGGGSGDQANNAQNTNVLLGKMLRLNVSTSATAPYYSVPSGNPYNNEVYDLGLRNPFRWSFDSQTGDMWIGDVGQNLWEEIDFRPAASPAGVNYGWRCYEGNSTFNSAGCQSASVYMMPVHDYPTGNPSGSITGGIVYRGAGFPNLQGWYIGADFYTGEFFKISPNGSGGWIVATQTVTPTGIVDFAETEDGEVYVVSYTDHSVHKMGTTNPVGLASGDWPTYVSVQTRANQDKELIVSLSENKFETVELYNLNGQRIISVELQGQNEIKLATSQLAAGIYLLRIGDNDRSLMRKIILD